MCKWQVLNQKYIKNGLKIMPVRQNAKLPVLNAWNKECSSDYKQVTYWYEHNHNFNWGLPCFENNLFVIDLDRHDEQKDGVMYFEKLCKDLGIDYPETMMQKTPSNGIHLIFQSNDILRDVNGISNAFQDYPGIDLRNRNYIVVEPSVINGNKYEFLNDLPPMPMPVKLQEYMVQKVGVKSEKKEPYVKPTEQIDIGNRDSALFEYITYLYYKTNLTYDEILILARSFNDTFTTPLSDNTVIYKVNKAFDKDRGKCILMRFSGNGVNE